MTTPTPTPTYSPHVQKALMDRLERGDAKFDEMAAAIAKIGEAVKPIEQISHDVEKTKEIVEAWAAVKTIGKFLKWVAPIAAILGAFLLWAKATFLFYIKG